jgi:putative Mg2+ transporter-C (MgtC) family protein
MVIKLLLSGLFGGIVGYEREVHEHPAGLRTHILVCMGATLITMVSMSFHNDPGRIAAQIVSGIGFLGAGTILRQGNVVRGLTTAASLWTVAGIGIAVGVGGPNGVFYILAGVTTLVVFVTLSTIRGFEPGPAKKSIRRLLIEFPVTDLEALGSVLEQLMTMGVIVQSVHSVEAAAGDKRAFKLKLALPRKVKPESIVNALAKQPGLDRFEWM